jgi:dihydrofolate reductase
LVSGLLTPVGRSGGATLDTGYGKIFGMRTLTVVESVSLDGVMQSPGRADEDTRDGFTHGGWAAPYMDQVAAEFMGVGMSGGESTLLLGRRTYDDFAGYWPRQTDNPYTPVLDAATKYVASRGTPRLNWANSVLLAGEATATVGDLKASAGPDLTVLGSGELVRALVAAGLVDECVLSIHPLVLGQGRRLFADGLPLTAFTLAESVPTTTGVIIARYRADR